MIFCNEPESCVVRRASRRSGCPLERSLISRYTFSVYWAGGLLRILGDAKMAFRSGFSRGTSAQKLPYVSGARHIDSCRHTTYNRAWSHELVAAIGKTPMRRSAAVLQRNFILSSIAIVSAPLLSSTRGGVDWRRDAAID